MADPFLRLREYLDYLERHDSRPSDPLMYDCLLDLNKRLTELERRQDQKDEMAMEGLNG